jgi:hypothetical protein
MRFAVCLMACLLASSGLLAAKDLTVLLDYDQPITAATAQALQNELESILANVPLQVKIVEREVVAEHQQFGELVLFRMSGRCSMQPLPVAAVSDERGPLAMTFASNGEPLPFGEVRCDRVRQSVLRTISDDPFHGQSPVWQDREYGVALARVMAHEIYHMLAHSTEHTNSGVTKRALRSDELHKGKLSMSADAKSRFAQAH